LNWIPFGGFVRIFGESDDGSKLSDEEKKMSLVHKPRWQQFLVMFGGILFNVIFAWVLFSGLFINGMQSSVDTAPVGYQFESTKLLVTQVLQGSPADVGGLKMGDEVKEYFKVSDREGEYDPILVQEEGLYEISDFINRAAVEGENVGFIVLRNDDNPQVVVMIPESGLVAERYAVGVNLEKVGILKLPFFEALKYGAKSVAHYTTDMAFGFWQLITGAIAFENVSGPIGIAGQVGETAKLGFVYLVMFTGLLSLNLAVINLVPFPALDGGRILVILIESIVRRRINPSIINWINAIGFTLLIGLMLLVTTKDIIKLF
jgi:regulator of sigma E protease